MEIIDVIIKEKPFSFFEDDEEKENLMEKEKPTWQNIAPEKLILFCRICREYHYWLECEKQILF